MKKKPGEIYERNSRLPRPDVPQHEGTKLKAFDNGKNMSTAIELYDDAVFMLLCIKGNLQLLKQTSAGADLDQLRQRLQKDFDFCARNLSQAAPWIQDAQPLLNDQLCPLARAYQFKINSYTYERNSYVVVRKKDFVSSSPTFNNIHTVAAIISQGFFGPIFNFVQEKLMPEDAPDAPDTPSATINDAHSIL